jgi:hypothetical protein
MRNGLVPNLMTKNVADTARYCFGQAIEGAMDE